MTLKVAMKCDRSFLPYCDIDIDCKMCVAFKNGGFDWIIESLSFTIAGISR